MNLKIFSLFFLLLLVGCPAELEVDSTGNPPVEDDRSWHTWEDCSQAVGDHPCNFKLLDHNGKEVELYDFYGKVIILDLSAMWCGVCVNIASTGEAIVEEFGRDNVVWITVLVEDEMGNPPDQSDLQRWIDYGAGEPVLGGDRSLIDPAAKSGYPVSGWPTIVVIDREMTLTHGVTGWSESLVRGWVSSLL